MGVSGDVPSFWRRRQPGRRFPPETLCKYTCYSFPPKLGRPDKAIYPPPAQPVQTLSLMFSLLQEINMFGSRQTTRLRRAAPFRSAGQQWGHWRQMYASESTSSASPESTLDTIKCVEPTPLRMISTAHMCYSRVQHSCSALCQVVSAFRKQNTERVLI